MPKAFFTNSRYSELSADAKLLYTVLLDRLSLSEKNGWYDEDERLFIYYSVKAVSELLGFGTEKVIKHFRELEKAELITRERQGLGKPSKIYPLKPVEAHSGEIVFKNSEKPTSEIRKNRAAELGKTVPNKTENNKTENSYTDLSIREIDAEEIEERVKFSMEYDVLSERVDASMLDEIVSIVTELMCMETPVIRIGGREQPRSLVHMRMKKLRCEHIEYVIDSMKENSTRIRDIKSYLISALFNAPATICHYYQSEVNADMAGE